METTAHRAVAVVGVGAVLPDAPNASTFWDNVKNGRYSISDVDPERWDPNFYFDPDPRAPDKSYTKIGGWVRAWDWDPLRWKLPIPPRVSDQMDRTQKWAVIATREALEDYGYPRRPLDPDRTAVIFGNAMAGDKHYITALRIFFPEYADELAHAPSFAALPKHVRDAVTEELHTGIGKRFPAITEDTMPGELANIIAGRVANLFNFHGPNFVVDAACASAMAAMTAAIEGLEEGDYDAVVTGGIDSNMSASTFTKFCKIGALSATGTRPYGKGADGFVMGEGAAIFVLKRLADAERDGDRIYAVIRGMGGSSDGRGKGITAPNPVGQRFAIARGWRNAGLTPDTATMIEGHGTSTRVGDVIEAESMTEIFKDFDLPVGSIPLGSVKSNIGHLKGAAGAAGMLKAALALHDEVLPPSLNCEEKNPNIDFARSPLYVNTELRPWDKKPDQVRRAGVSAFGFGGTNFHAVLEEHIPGRLTTNGRTMVAGAEIPRAEASAPSSAPSASHAPAAAPKPPLRGALVVGGDTPDALRRRLEAVRAEALAGRAPEPAPPAEADLRAPLRIAIDYGDAAELATKIERALKALDANHPGVWKALRAQGIFKGEGPAPKVAFLYTGQGSQYANMLAGLRKREPIVADVFDEADAVMEPILGKPLSEYIFIDADDPEAAAQLEEDLRQTEITQPAVLAADEALTRLLAAYGIVPDMVMGHSLGEYGALVASGALSFADALRAVSARAHAMREVSIEDNGWMAAVFAPLEETQKLLERVDGYVVIANLNSHGQSVIGGATEAVREAMKILQEAGYEARRIPVSHAFHTSIVAPASEPLMRYLKKLDLHPPATPIVANVTGAFYPMHPGVEDEMIEMLGRQVASPVQFVKGLKTLYDAGARVFVETGPKKALRGFAEDVLGDDPEVSVLFTNHPKIGDEPSFNQALCGLYAAGLGVGVPEAHAASAPEAPRSAPGAHAAPSGDGLPERPAHPAPDAPEDDRFTRLGRFFADVLERGMALYRDAGLEAPSSPREPVVITGAALGLPGAERVFDEENLRRLLDGEQFIDVIPVRIREAMVDKHITRLVKSEHGGPRFEVIEDPSEVVKLAGRMGAFDLAEFGVPEERIPALNIVTRLALGAGIEALRDAGIPLVMHYKTTTTGSRLPERWRLPDDLRDDTGVIFASAFPDSDALAEELTRYHADRARRERLADLESLRVRLAETDGANTVLAHEIDRRIHELRHEIETNPYTLDRRFLFRILSMGHSQFAEYIGARGPNTQINAACASTPQAVSLAEDWIRNGRCARVLIISGDNVTTDNMLEWIGAGFLATGAAATDELVSEAALPFDRRRHGMVVGMGAAALVVERASAVRERGLRPICEVLGTITRNSAFHGTRLDVNHIAEVMETLVAQAEKQWGIDRRRIAREMVFVSHETYTPARGGSAQAEINALRHVFGDAVDGIVMANTKGYTGHAMGAGIEDVLAVKALETGIVPPIPNFREADPDLGKLNLSKGGFYPIRYALRLGAGFGSQISMTLHRWVPTPDGERRAPDELGFEYRIADPQAWQAWLRRVSGYDAPALEVVGHTLRIRDDGPPAAPRRTTTVETMPVETPPKPVPASAPPAPVRVEVAPAPAPEPTNEVPAAEVTAETAPAEDDVTAKVLAIVADVTGYPTEMLDLDLDLEADLGIDTVKQAEMFAAVREAFGIERDDDLQLRDFPTLGHVIQFARDRSAGTDGGTPVTAAAAPAREEAPALTGDDEAAARVPRRVPVAVVRPELTFFKPTGVTLDEGARVLVTADRGGVGKALAKRLEKRGVTVLMIDDAPEAEVLAERLEAFLAEGPIDGVYWLPALDLEGPVEGMDLAAWREALRVRVKLLYATMRVVYDRLGTPGFLVAGTRLGGRHGYDDAGAVAPLGGAVTGFVKSFKRERPEGLAKAVDFAPGRKTAALADRLLDETLRDPGVVEVGYDDDGTRYAVGLETRPLPEDGAGLTLGADTVFVVTGAAGSIVSAITADLAAHSGGTFYLLDLVPKPDPDDPDLARFAADREGLKRDLFERIKASGERATPAKVARELARLERAHAALTAIRAVEAAGGTAHYHSADLRDPDAVARALGAVRDAHGRIDVLLHAAGLEISHRLPEKPPSEFDLVFDVKADGWFNLLHAAGDMPLGASVAFSSIAGRFGNAGQTDYSAANDLLCKCASNFRTTRPDTHGLAIDWTAWDRIGMASRGSIPKVMASVGIDMLPPEAGIPVIRRELTKGDARGEVVVAGSLGLLLEPFDATGGLDPATLDLPAGPMAESVPVLDLFDGLTVTATLDPKAQPFLDDHRIDGTAVLPGVMGVEAFAEAARLAFPDRHAASVEDVRFLAPFKFYRDAPRTVTVHAVFRRAGDDLLAVCRLTGARTLPNHDEPVVTTHFTGTVRLTRAPVEAPEGEAPPEPEGPTVTQEDLYEIYFHGPAYRVVEAAWRAGDAVVGKMPETLPPGHVPETLPLATAPRRLELCFQTAGVAEMGETGAMGLPAALDRVAFFGAPEPETGVLYALVREAGGAFDADVVDARGRVYAALRGYRTARLPGSVDAEALAPLRAVMHTADA